LTRFSHSVIDSYAFTAFVPSICRARVQCDRNELFKQRKAGLTSALKIKQLLAVFYYLAAPRKELTEKIAQWSSPSHTKI
jgi:hypothetical protein